MIQLNLKYIDNFKFYYKVELQIYYSPVIKWPTSLRYLYSKREKKLEKKIKFTTTFKKNLT